MEDLLYLAVVGLFFAVCWGFVRLCEALGRQT